MLKNGLGNCTHVELEFDYTTLFTQVLLSYSKPFERRKADDKIEVCKFQKKNVLIKLYHIEKSKTRVEHKQR